MTQRVTQKAAALAADQVTKARGADGQRHHPAVLPGDAGQDGADAQELGRRAGRRLRGPRRARPRTRSGFVDEIGPLTYQEIDERAVRPRRLAARARRRRRAAAWRSWRATTAASSTPASPRPSSAPTCSTSTPPSPARSSSRCSTARARRSWSTTRSSPSSSRRRRTRSPGSSPGPTTPARRTRTPTGASRRSRSSSRRARRTRDLAAPGEEEPHRHPHLRHHRARPKGAPRNEAGVDAAVVAALPDAAAPRLDHAHRGPAVPHLGLGAPRAGDAARVQGRATPQVRPGGLPGDARRSTTATRWSSSR